MSAARRKWRWLRPGGPGRRDLCAAALAVIVVLLLAAAPASAQRPEARGLKTFCCMVPMRDGARLATDVYLPRFPRARYPVVLIRTPNGRHEITRLESRYVTRRGFGLVIQDTRGRHGSQGGPTLAFVDGGWGRLQDGHDTISWIARQPWCDGRVATWGASVMGITENMLAPGAPAALRAQHVIMAFSDMYTQAAYQGGVLRQSLATGWLGAHNYDPINLRAVYEHYRYDAFWAQLNPQSQAARVDAPAVFWGGWYDIFLQGSINSFVTIQSEGGPRARGHCRLVLGPWTHGDVRRIADPRNAACYPRAGEAFRFFQYWLKCVPNGVPRDKPVHYYVMGDRCDRSAPGNCWRAADAWPPPSRPTRFYFRDGGRLTESPPEEAEAALSYRFDPRDPVPTLGGRNLYLPCGPKDQRPVEDRPDVLVFTTEPLKRPLEVTGRLRAELHISSDCPDTDFTVKLCDVYPDGRSMLVADGILRARFRESFSEEKFLEPGQVYRLEVDLWSTSLALGRGHRVRVEVSSSNAPRFEPNPNNGQPHMGMGEPRTATNTLHVSREHPSFIVLPIYAGED